MSKIGFLIQAGEQIKVYGEPLLHEILNLVDCINRNGEPMVSIDDAIKSLKIVEAARMSILTADSASIEI